MLDQTFSIKNFKKIINLYNNKGINVEGLYLPKVFEITKEISKVNEGKNEKKSKLYREKREILNKKLKQIEENIINLNIKMKKIELKNKKQMYSIKKNKRYSENFFMMKQLQYNFRKLYKIKQANRNKIIEQLIRICNNKFPKFILRTDIKSFYESIDQTRLFKRIYSENLLSIKSKKIIKDIIKKFNRKKDSDDKKGIPRGIGISALLSEYYMRQIDKKIKMLLNIELEKTNNKLHVIYYKRYVDDIIIIFVPKKPVLDKKLCEEKIKDKIREIVNKAELNLNKDKTSIESNIQNSNNPSFNFNYLGYKFEYGNRKLELFLTIKKIKKYKKKINLTFSRYLNVAKINEKEARKHFVKRIRFLTGNTKLKSIASRNVLTGIFYSNKYLTDKGMKKIEGLDKYLKNKIDKKLNSESLKKRLKQYSFYKSFKNKRFSPFKSYELKKIVKIWKGI